MFFVDVDIIKNKLKDEFFVERKVDVFEAPGTQQSVNKP